MSPVSRHRKKQPPRRQSGGHPARRALVAANLPFIVLERELTSTADSPSALAPLLVVSDLLGVTWGIDPHGKADAAIVSGLLEYSRERARPASLAAALLLSRLAPDPEARDAAKRLADGLADSGVPSPRWTEALRDLRVGECWELADVYGDQTSVALICELSGESFVVLAMIDFNHLGGWVKDCFVHDEPVGLMAELRIEAKGSVGLAVLRKLDPAAARGLLTDSFAATDETWEPDVAETFRSFRALALAVTRTLPDGSDPVEVADPSESERDQVVEEFLASSEAVGLAPDHSVRYLTRLLVDYGADYDAGRLRRIGPGKLEIILLGFLPRKVVLDQDDRAALPAVVRAWARWAARVEGIPRRAADDLYAVTDELLEAFADVYDDPANAGPAKAFMQGLAALDSEADVNAALAGLLPVPPRPPAPAPESVLQLKIDVAHAKPPIWRRLQIPATATFADLHLIIQSAFGWQHAHLHQFEAAGRRFAPDNPSTIQSAYAPPAQDERVVPVREVLRATGDHAVYWYDFGDDWYHDVVLERVLPANAVAHPVCIGGRRAGPLEDSGGIHSYQQMCAALADPGDPDHAAGREWLEQVHGWIGWDPAHFDRAELNRRLAEIVLPLG